MHLYRAFCVIDGLDSLELSKIIKPVAGSKCDNIVDDISAHMTERRAMGTIYDKYLPKEGRLYSIYLASIDTAIYLSNICLYLRLSRNFNMPLVPKYIKEIYIGRPKGPIWVVRDATNKGYSRLVSNLVGVSNRKVILSWIGLKLLPLSNSLDITDNNLYIIAILK